jgi:flagellin-like protein
MISSRILKIDLKDYEYFSIKIDIIQILTGNDPTKYIYRELQVKSSDKMKKGITPVIAIILLLLITISMVGFAFVWFSRLQGSIQDSVTNKTDSQINAMGKTVVIDLASNSTGSIAIRNSGTSTINAAEYKLYVAGVDRTTSCSGPIVPGATVVCSTTYCPMNGVVKVTAPGNTDETNCQ